MPTELKASEALAQHRNIIFRKALEKLKAEERLDEAELAEIERRKSEDEKRKEKTPRPTKKRGGGRPPNLTRDLIAKICKEVSEGATYEEASILCGIYNQRISDWKNKAESVGGIYEEFADEIAAAEKRYLQRNRILLNRAAERGNWQAALTILERKDAANWGRKVTVEGQIGNSIHINQNNTVVMVQIPDNGYSFPENVETEVKPDVNGNGTHLIE